MKYLDGHSEPDGQSAGSVVHLLFFTIQPIGLLMSTQNPGEFIRVFQKLSIDNYMIFF